MEDRRIAFMMSLLLTSFVWQTHGALPSREHQWPDFDARAKGEIKQANVSAERRAAAQSLRDQVPGAKVEFDPITGSARFVSVGADFLSGPNGQGKAISAAAAASVALNDSNRVTKAFLQEHTRLFGFGPEALDKAMIVRDFHTSHNGLRTVVWEQQVREIPVFESVFISHTTQRGELVNISSQFVPDADAATARRTTSRALASPTLAPAAAVAIAGKNVGAEVRAEDVKPVLDKANSGQGAADPQRQQHFRSGALKGQADVKLVWLPLAKARLGLCWDVVLAPRNQNEMFRILVDAETGEVLLRHCLTEYISDATYRVFTSDSPTPMSPGLSSAASTQPAYVPSRLVTISALDTNASPNGWIDDGATQTLGNNVDAHTDLDGDNMPDLPRPDGGTNRLFDFTMDLSTDDPTNYSQASVVNLFYWCNWMHDKLYDLGFTEAAGNFQATNFARGGVEGDPVLADAQDGSGFNNANFSTPLDGSSGRMQMYIFSGPSPQRDGDLDAEVILHEYAHGLSNRRVGGGVLISAIQSRGMGEGWSDFFALSLLSDVTDDPNADYAMGAYVGYMLGGLAENYYYGIRRYPYTTDMLKNPLTFKDIDPTQADSHSPVPRSAVVGNSASDIHNQGEVWCVTLWEARANLINKCGGAAGNQLMLQLVTDGMNLSPPNPTFLQARDAILQADRVDTGGTNQMALWAAFAKRGMGFSASAPASLTTTGVQEAYDFPDDLRISPRTGFVAVGPAGGAFVPNAGSLTLTNVGTNTAGWGLSVTSVWLNVSNVAGAIPPASAQVIGVGVDESATNLTAGIYFSTIVFTNSSSTNLQARQYVLKVGQPDAFTEIFDADDNDLAFRRFTFTPDSSVSGYSVCQEAAAAFSTDPAGGANLTLTDDSSVSVTLSGTNTVSIYGTTTNVFFIGSNGYLTMNAGDINYQESAAAHFSLPRVSAFFHDLNPETGGTISWKELNDRAVVTYQNVSQFGSPQGNNFQMEMFFDGRIRLTYLSLNCLNNLVGLSAGTGVPPVFVESDFSSYGFCPPAPPVFVTQPAGQVLKPGTSLSLGALVSGAEPFAFQWQKNGTNLFNDLRISGTTNSNLTITNLIESDTGIYRLLVTNAYGANASSNAFVAVTAVDHFVWNHIPSPQSAGVPFSIGLQARDSADRTATNFNGIVSFNASNGALSAAPAASGNFNHGIWTGSLCVTSAVSNVILVADDGLGHSGATSVQIAIGPHLDVEPYGDILLIVWTAGAPQLKLQTTTNMNSGVWVNAPAPVQIGDDYVSPFSMNEPARFYRLKYGN